MNRSSFPNQLSGALTIARKKVTGVVQSFHRTQFSACYEGTPNGHNLPCVSGLYAFKHQDGCILYVGKSNNIRNRFREGHDVFVRLFFAGYSPPEVRIAVAPLTGNDLPYLEPTFRR